MPASFGDYHRHWNMLTAICSGHDKRQHGLRAAFYAPLVPLPCLALPGHASPRQALPEIADTPPAPLVPLPCLAPPGHARPSLALPQIADTPPAPLVPLPCLALPCRARPSPAPPRLELSNLYFLGDASRPINQCLPIVRDFAASCVRHFVCGRPRRPAVLVDGRRNPPLMIREVG